MVALFIVLLTMLFPMGLSTKLMRNILEDFLILFGKTMNDQNKIGDKFLYKIYNDRCEFAEIIKIYNDVIWFRFEDGAVVWCPVANFHLFHLMFFKID